MVFFVVVFLSIFDFMRDLSGLTLQIKWDCYLQNSSVFSSDILIWFSQGTLSPLFSLSFFTSGNFGQFFDFLTGPKCADKEQVTFEVGRYADVKKKIKVRIVPKNCCSKITIPLTWYPSESFPVFDSLFTRPIKAKQKRINMQVI